MGTMAAILARAVIGVLADVMLVRSRRKNASLDGSPPRSSRAAIPAPRLHSFAAAGQPRSEFPQSGTYRPPIATPVGDRLIGDAGMVDAVGQVAYGLAATEEEVGCTRIADRPAAARIRELEQRAALSDRDDVLSQLDLGLRLGVVGRQGLTGERRVAAHRRARHAHHMRRWVRLAGPRRRR